MSATHTVPDNAPAALPTLVSAWFEIPVLDFERARRFYEALLGVQLREERMGPSHMAIFPSTTCASGGCLCAMEGYAPSTQGSVVYLTTSNDVQQHLDRAVALGGAVLWPRTELPEGMGVYAQIRDCEGNRVGLYSRV